MKRVTTDQLIRRAHDLLKEQTVLVGEFQKLKFELLQRNRETLELHKRFAKLNHRFCKPEKRD